MHESTCAEQVRFIKKHPNLLTIAPRTNYNLKKYIDEICCQRQHGNSSY